MKKKALDVSDEGLAELRAWVDRGGHLPSVIQSSADQQELFRSVDDLFGRASEPYGVDASRGRGYVIDRFLHFIEVQARKPRP